MDFFERIESGGGAPVAEVRPDVGARRAPSPTQASCSQCPVRRLCFVAVSAEEDEGAHALSIGRRRLRPGQFVFEDAGDFMSVYVVRTGTVKSSVQLADGREQVTGFHLPGELMGMDAIALGRYATSAVALEQAEVCSIPYPELSQLASETRSLRQRLWAAASAQIVRAQEAARLLATVSADARVAGFLLDVSRRMKERGWSAHEFYLRMTRHDIGSFLGLTLETVSRSLSQFAHRRLIEVSNRHIRILDHAALEAYEP